MLLIYSGLTVEYYYYVNISQTHRGRFRHELSRRRENPENEHRKPPVRKKGPTFLSSYCLQKPGADILVEGSKIVDEEIPSPIGVSGDFSTLGKKQKRTKFAVFRAYRA